MKRKILILCLILLIMVGCVSIKKTKIAIELEGNPTTGYGWIFKMEKDDIVNLVDTSYKQEKSNKNITGAPGVYTWVFEGQKEGKVKLTFNYAQNWEDKEAFYSIDYILNVDAKGQITTESIIGTYGKAQIPAPIYVR